MKERKAAKADWLSDFKNPPGRFRGKPFWAWNGRLDLAELIRQLRVIKDMGFGGHFMHSRVGLATPYLGPKWFDLVNAVADESGKLDLEAWLYDEDRWPSGSAGGLAVRDEKFRARYLRLRFPTAAEFRWDESTLAAFTARLNGIDYEDLQPLARQETPPPDRPDRTILAFSVETMRPGPFYNGGAYLDTMNPEAVREFLRVTHDRYDAECGDRFGKTIRGLFTDEPHRGIVMSSFLAHPDPTWVVPWTPALPDEYRRRFGDDLLARLPELFLRPAGRRISPVKWRFMELLQQLFIEHYLKPVGEWCRDRGLALTGHMLQEDSLAAQAVPTGSMMRTYEYMDVPGIDVLTDNRRAYWAAKQLSSAARQFGRASRLSELYGATGWAFDFYGHKYSGDWQALFGVNLRCPHLSWYTMQGEAKRDYPASILHQSAWHKDYKAVEEYFARIHVWKRNTAPDCRLLVLHPVESVWAQIHHGWVDGLDAACPHIAQIEKTFRDVFETLAGHHIDFDYGDEDILARHGRVEALGWPRLTVGNGVYSAVLVAGLETIRSSTLTLLESFAGAGGKVVFAGDPPRHVDAEKSRRAAELARRSLSCTLSDRKLSAACLQALDGTPARIADRETGRDVADIFCEVRNDPASTWVLALNMNRDEPRPGVVVSLAGEGAALERWDLRSGARFSVPATATDDGRLEAVVDFPPGGEVLLRRAREPKSGLPAWPRLETVRRLDLKGPFRYRLEEPNVCVLDYARWRIDGGDWQAENEILKIDDALRDRFSLPRRGGEMCQPWFTAGAPHPALGAIELEFAFDVSDLPRSDLHLAIETPERFAGDLNGHPLMEPDADAFWVDRCFKMVPIPYLLIRKGRNVIRLKADYRDDLDLEALYLLGDFAVRVTKRLRSIARKPPVLEAGSLVDQGFPFYGGRLSLRADLPKNLPREGRLFLEIPDLAAACATVRTGRYSKQLVAWPPFEAEITGAKPGETIQIDLSLTRRNTFGPLHQLPSRPPWIDPQSFRTTGDDWSEDYVLQPSGLLLAPEIAVRVETPPDTPPPEPAPS